MLLRVLVAPSSEEEADDEADDSGVQRREGLQEIMPPSFLHLRTHHCVAMRINAGTIDSSARQTLRELAAQRRLHKIYANGPGVSAGRAAG